MVTLVANTAQSSGDQGGDGYGSGNTGGDLAQDDSCGNAQDLSYGAGGNSGSGLGADDTVRTFHTASSVVCVTDNLVV